MANGLSTPNLDLLREGLGADWPCIRAATVLANLKRQELANTVSTEVLIPPDCSLVVFGSLARGEWTDGSDLDWVLLVDAQVSGSHYEAMLKLRTIFEGRSAGSTGLFGGLTFSHDLVHFIGGEDGSNRNLTLRMLLLLESCAIGDDAAYQRVVRSLLGRYLIQPSSFSHAVTPRFLLNDLVRYWRTIAVDYAGKFQDQAGRKAVLRNVKLRFSRKLIYAAGLAACLDWYKSPLDSVATSALFQKMVDVCPLELMAAACVQHAAPEADVRGLFDNYEQFLCVMSDSGQRAELAQLAASMAGTNPLFSQLREAGHSFQASLSSLVTLIGGGKLVQYAIF